MLAQILLRTPTWVYVLFVALAALGLLQTRTRTVSGARLAVLPVALGAFSVYGVYADFGPQPAAVAGWGTGMVLAFMLNGVLKQPRGVRYDPAGRVFLMPGSWIPLALMMTMFFTRYAVTVAIATDPARAAAPAFVAATCLAYGLLSGTFFARALQCRSVALRATAPAIGR
jgi:hypothetical protein